MLGKVLGRSLGRWGRRLCSGRQRQEAILGETLAKGEHLSLDEVAQLKERLLSSGRAIDQSNFEAVFIDSCQKYNLFKTAKEFFYSLYRGKEANIAAMGKFCKLCYSDRESCTEDDKEMVKKLHRELLAKYGILDCNLCESVACGLSVTDAWREGVPLLKMAYETGSPSSIAYSALIEAAFLNSAPTLAWTLLQEMLLSNKSPLSSVYITYFMTHPKEVDTLNNLLTFLMKNNVFLDKNVADILKDYHDCVIKSFTQASYTEISRR